MADKILTQARLKELFNFDAGVFTRLVTINNRAQTGSIAGALNSKGYIRIGIAGTQYQAHRLAWLYVYGEWPAAQLDHVNRVRYDNRIENLRLATPSENMQNRPLFKNNKSGYPGVYWHERKKKYWAYITVNRQQISLDYHTTLDDAIAARKAGERKYHTFQHS